MNSKEWQIVANLFERALTLAPDEREPFLLTECPDDAGLRNAVLILLQSDQEARDFLETPALAALVAAPNPSPATLISPGDLLLNRFRIIKRLGEGGMGQVFEAFDSELHETVAVKLLRPEIATDPAAIQRFKKEVQLAHRVTHPNICRTFSLERDSNFLSQDASCRISITFLTMEFLGTSETLSSYLSRHGPLSSMDALPILLQILDGLRAAHSAGIIHRDLKPSNIFLVDGSSKTRVVVADFGVAAAHGDAKSMLHQTANRTEADTLAGTLAYMAPEQIEGADVTPATDIYAFGLVAYEVITGRRPFASNRPFAEIIDRLKQTPPCLLTYIPNLNPALETVILRCLRVLPEERFRDASDVSRALAEASSYSKPARSFEPALSPLRYGFRISRTPLLVLGFLIFMSLLAAGVRFYLWRRNSPAVQQGSMLMIAPIENETHDQEFNGLNELVKDQLRLSNYINILADNEIRETEARMGKPSAAEPDPQTAREIAMRQQVPLLLFGTVSKLAGDYKLDLKLEKVGDQPFYSQSSWTFSDSSTNKTAFFEIVRRGSAWVRKTAGENAAELNQNERHPEDVTTNSWEALRLYAEGQKRAAQDQLDEAVLLFKEATVRDPEFAMAFMRVGDILDTQGKTAEGFQYWKKALSVSGERRLSTREELRMRGMFANDVGDLKSAIDFFGQYSIAYPNDYLGFFYRAYPLMLLGKPEQAIRMLEIARKLNPQSYYVADHLARYQLIVDNLAESSRYAAVVRSLGHPDEASLLEGQTQFLAGDLRGAETTFASLHNSSDPFVRSTSYYESACVLAETGRYRQAIALLKEGAQIDAGGGAIADQADKLLAVSYLNLRSRNLLESRDFALEALRLENSLRRSGDAATVLARGGWTKNAERILSDIGRDRSQDYETLTRTVESRIRGELLLAHKQANSALENLRTWKQLNQETAFLQDSYAVALISAGQNHDAFDELQALRKNRGQIWHQPESYMPGVNSDLLFLEAREAARLGRPEARELLAEYCKRRESADSDLPEVVEAISLLRHLGN